jgi:2-haloacid dehalogenase
MTLRSVAVFDLGGVLIDWNPRHLYRKLFVHEADMEHFLANICTPEWNQQQDAGRSFAQACAALKRDHPGYAAMIDAWFERFDEMMAGPIAGAVDILSELRDREVPIYALSNWPGRPSLLRRKDSNSVSGSAQSSSPPKRAWSNLIRKFLNAFAKRLL